MNKIATKKAPSVKPVNTRRKKSRTFNPFKLVSDEEFCTNMNAIIAYYQVIKGEKMKRINRIMSEPGELLAS